MDIIEATHLYESRAKQFTDLDHAEVVEKHLNMANLRDAFPFFRATYYRWAEIFPTVLPKEQEVPRVLAVGDLHLENFGTWRDLDSRPVFGVNDLDEVDHLPFTNDLIRLACSFRFALRSQRVCIDIKPRELTDAILFAYVEALRNGALPIVLSEDQGTLGQLLGRLSEQPEAFWKRVAKKIDRKKVDPPAEVRQAIEAAVTVPLQYTYHRRRSVGLGSLGRVRYVGLTELSGARLMREAKARVPAATVLANESQATAAMQLSKETVLTLLAKRRDMIDPSVQILDGWTIRRLAPDSLRIELPLLTEVKNWHDLAGAMGRETASLHCCTADAKSMLRALRSRPMGWLNDAAKKMAVACNKDWHAWRDYAGKKRTKKPR